MSQTLRLFVFVDALGWDLAERSRAFAELDVVRRPLETQFGYSSACLPTILSGADPSAHGHWNLFCRPAAPGTFRRLRWLSHLPGQLRLPARAQGAVSRAIARACGLEGYFALHRIPLQRLHELDVDERRDLFGLEALPATGSIIDDARASGRAIHVSDWRQPEAARWQALSAALRGPRRLEWGFLYLAGLDAALHRDGWPGVGPDAWLVDAGRRLRALRVEAAGLGYRLEVALFSDHGMSNVREVVDLRALVRRAVPAVEGREYHALYDSTMARFWSDDLGLRARLATALAETPGVRVVDADTLRAWGAHFPDGRHGHVIGLLEAGALIVPSDMGRRPLCGMHGYAPDHPDGRAALLADHDLPTAPTRLRDLRALMTAGLDAPRATTVGAA